MSRSTAEGISYLGVAGNLAKLFFTVGKLTFATISARSFLFPTATQFRLVQAKFSVVCTGGEVVHARNKGTRGNPSRRFVRERIKEIGTRGRLMKACHGQLLGSSVRTKSNLK